MNEMCKVMMYLVCVLVVMMSWCNMSSSQPTGTLEQYASSLAPYLDKRYELASSDEQFDAVLAELGMDIVKRKMAEIAAPAIRLTRQGDVFTLTTDTIFKQFVTKFKLDEEFEEETVDGRHVRTLFTLDGNQLLQIERGDKTLYTLREFTADTVRTTLAVDHLSSVRLYKLANSNSP